MAYWDTSCLLKLYALESDSAHFRGYLAGGAAPVTSEIARLEMYAALQRKEAAGDLSIGGGRQAIAAYDRHIALGLIDTRPLDSVVTRQFETIVEQCYNRHPPLPLRTLDAIHLATAISSNQTELVATDKRLREAAIIFGLSVYPPP